jgi:hypothetical protein
VVQEAAVKAKLGIVDVSSVNVPDRIIMNALPASPRCTPGSPRPMPTGLAYTASAIDDRAEALLEEIKHLLRRVRARAHVKPCVSDQRNSDPLERRRLRHRDEWLVAGHRHDLHLPGLEQRNMLSGGPIWSGCVPSSRLRAGRV